MTAGLEELHLRRLLVAFDGSDNSRLALRAAITAARRDNASVALICVAPEARPELTGLSVAAGMLPPSQEKLDAEAERVLRTAVELVPEDIPVRMVVGRGKPGPAIIAHVRKCDYDAILLGARGRGRVGSMLGSVSAYVIHHADVAVFVAHAPRAEAPAAAEPD